MLSFLHYHISEFKQSMASQLAYDSQACDEGSVPSVRRSFRCMDSLSTLSLKSWELMDKDGI